MRRIDLMMATLLVAGCGGRGRELAPIRIEPVASYGDDSGDGVISGDPRVSGRHPRGFRILISGAGGVSALPQVYSDSGRYLATLHGGATAPEQFQVPLFSRFGPGDSIWIFDGAQRALVFGPDLRYARAVELPASPWDALVLPDGRMLIAPANADHPLPLLLTSPTGARDRELGAADSASTALHSPRWLVRQNDGSIWSMPVQFQWRLEHWDSNGALLSVTNRRPSWFAPYTQLSTPGTKRAPQPMIEGMWIDPTGLFWVLGSVADPHWRRGLDVRRSAPESAVIANPDQVFDSDLEAIDLRTGKLIASARLDPAYSSVVEPGVIMHVRSIPTGWKRVDLMRVSLERPSK